MVIEPPPPSLMTPSDPPVSRSLTCVGDAGFAALYSDEFGRISGLVRSLVGRRDIADEITQDAFVVAHDHWAKVSGYDRPQDYVRRVALNRAVSTLRRRGAEHRALGRLTARPGAEAPAPDAVDDSPLWRHVRRLPARQRQVIALVYVEDMALDQVAAVLGIRESSVKTHLQRGRTTLAAALASERTDDERTVDTTTEEDR